MGNVNTTPWMSLPNPVPSVDPGPDYASNLQACINGIDQHNHSPGSGQAITPNGLSINTDLTFLGNSATHLKASIYLAQSSFATLLSTYVIGNDLYYNDGAGNVVQITSGGLVNATSSGISSGTATAAFATGVLVVKSSSTSGANILMQSAVLTNNGNLTNQLTLSAPTLSTSVTQTLPAIPLSTAFMTMDTSGNMATSVNLLGALTTSNLSASAGIVGTQLSASANIAGSQLSASAGIVGTQLAAGTITGTQVSSSATLSINTLNASAGIAAPSIAGSGAVSVNGHNAVTSNTNPAAGTNSVSVIRGIVTSGSKTGGEGFTCSGSGTTITVTWTTAFADAPSVVVSGISSGSVVATTASSTGGCTIDTADSSQSCHFIAIGRRV
jgi:hypothetical protein